MRKTVIAACAALLLAPRPAAAWGYEAHRLVMDRAIALLPDAIRPLFEQHRAIVVERSIDPDVWRAVGFAGEGPTHYLNLDWEGYGTYPFAGLPRDFTAAVARFGRERIEENGTLPWRTEEFFGNLRRAFESYARRGPFGRYDILFFSAALGHYAADAHVPLHAVRNHDGQLTGQRGIHARFESIMFERFRDRLAIAPKAARAIATPRDFIFDAVLEGTRLAPAILAADLKAIGARDVYDERYYEAFFAAARPVMERRLNESITAVAGLIAGAWEAAGRPAVPVHPPTPPQRLPPPR